MARHRAKKRLFVRDANGIAGFGIYATSDLRRGDVVFRGEERSTRLVTQRHVLGTWPEDQIEVFRQYAMRAGDGIYMLWDEDPREWAPQNHSCDPNTAYFGLNVIALRDIQSGEELTLDYGKFGNHDVAPFACSCGAENCRGTIGFNDQRPPH
jgi:D-alanine-D-alanine ligase